MSAADSSTRFAAHNFNSPDPGYLHWQAESSMVGDHHTYIARISDSSMAPNPNVRTFGPTYAKKQVWNADHSRVLMWAPFATPETSLILLNGDFSFNRILYGVSFSHFWLNTHPDYIVTTTPELPELRLFNVETQQTTVMADFAPLGYRAMEWTPGGGEGNQSNDDRYWPVGLQDNSGAWFIVIWDQQTGQVTGRIPLPQPPGPGYPVDWHGMSQSGEFVVTSSMQPWSNGIYNIPAGLNVWSRSGQYLRTYYTAAGGTQNHADLGVDSDGRDVLVYMGAEHGGVTNDKFIATWRLDGSDGNFSRRQLAEGYLNGYYHISCRNLLRPGMCVFSTFATEPQYAAQMDAYPLNNRIFAVMLDGSQRIAPIANARHSIVGVDNLSSYDMQAHATPNRDLSAVMFRSVWNYFATTAPATTHAFVAHGPIY